MVPGRAERIAARQADLLTELLTALKASVMDGVPADAYLARFYHGHPEFGSRDRRLISGVAFSYFRWKGWIDRIAHSVEAACVLAHLLESDDIHPAVQRLAHKTGLPASALVALGGRAIPEKALALAGIAGTDFLLSELIPGWIIPMLGPGSGQMIEAFQSPPPTWLRVAPSDRPSILPVLKQSGTDPVTHPLIPSAIGVRRGINLRSLPQPVRKKVDIQDLASQATGLICAPHAHESWWDACCGSGGKTLHLAELGGRSVSILATDVRASILDELSRRLGDPARCRVRTALWDGAVQPPPEGPFDGILLDAPCSGTGTWHRNPDARWRITPETMTHLTKLQASLIRACSTRLKPGGVLVYATCSVTRNENEDLVSSFLKDTPGYRLSPFLNPIDGTSCDGQLRIQPWTGPCNGMFIAKLMRVEASP